MNAKWNDIAFSDWVRGDISVSTNEYADGPVILQLEGDGYDQYDRSKWMTPTEARDLASMLIAAADAADAAGRKS